MTTSTTTAAPSAATTDETPGADIEIRIDAGPVTPDFDGRSRGWQCCLILDPEDRDVTLYTAIGNGVPMRVWHNRAITLSVNEAASGEHVAEILEAHRAEIDAAFETYQGAEWDGHNMVGSWLGRHCDDAAEGCGEEECTCECQDCASGIPAHESILAGLQAALEDAPCYWSASDWLGGAWSESRRDLEKKIGDLDGDALDRKLDAVAADWVHTGACDGAILDQDNVREQLDRMVEELREGDEALWVVERGLGDAVTALDEADVGECIADLKDLGETWWIVEATSEYTARVVARKVREQGAGAGLATVRDLLDAWNSDVLERIGEHLPA